MPLQTLNYTEYLFVSIEAPLLKSIQQKLKGKKKGLHHLSTNESLTQTQNQ